MKAMNYSIILELWILLSVRKLKIIENQSKNAYRNKVVAWFWKINFHNLTMSKMNLKIWELIFRKVDW